MRPRSHRRVVSVLACLVALASCGDANDEDQQPFTVTFAKGTARIRCAGGDCAVGVVSDGGLFFVGGTRTVDGVTEQQLLELPQLTNVDIQTGDGKDRILFDDSHVPGTIRISTGGGDDYVDLCDSSAATATGIEGGAGDDGFSLGSGGYGDRLRLYAGPGDDAVYLEGLSFPVGDVLVDGGDGTDQVDVAATNVHAGLEIVDFEQRPDD